jgi:hypothetical protein
MDPISTAIALSVKKLIATVSWTELADTGLKSAAGAGGKDLWSRLQRNDQKKMAKLVGEFFLDEFYKELDAKLNLSAALPAYEDALKIFLRDNLIELLALFDRPTLVPDLSPLRRTWESSHYYGLPEGFDWSSIAQRVSDELRRAMKADERFRPLLELTVQEDSSEKLSKIAVAVERGASPDVGFNVALYKKYLLEKSNTLQLSIIHHTTYAYEAQVDVWSVFVPQSAHMAAPAPKLPRVVFRRLNEEGYISQPIVDREVQILSDQFRMSPVASIVHLAESEPRLVVLGDPGSGKTVLLNYLTILWCEKGRGRMPFRIDLREYVRNQRGFVSFLSKSVTGFQMDAAAITETFKKGDAVLQCDGLDEIFDVAVRASVIEEIAAFGTRFEESAIMVTTRIIGYESTRLRNSGFAHATLIDFDRPQMTSFLSLWHQKTEKSESQRSLLQGRLESAIGTSAAIRELAGNPLLLTMMAILNRSQELPRNRRELYREASRMLVHEWDTRRFLLDRNLDHQDKEKFLCILAGHMQAAEEGLAGNLIDRTTLVAELRKYLDHLGIADSYNKSREMVVQLTERNFILAFAGAERFAFVHRTFLEYFCASWFFDQLCISQKLRVEQFCEQVLDRHVDDPAWREVLCLLVGMLGEGDAEKIIRWIIQSGGQSAGRAVLAARCLNEVRSRAALATLDRDVLDNMKSALEREHQELDLSLHVTEAELDEYEDRLPRLYSAEIFETLATVWRTKDTYRLLTALIVPSRRFVMGSEILSVVCRNWPDLPETKELLIKYLSSEDEQLRTAAFWNLTIRRDHQEVLTRPMVERAMNDPYETVGIAAFDYYVIRFVSEDMKPEFFRNAAIANNHRELRLHVLGKYSDHIPSSELIEIYRNSAVKDSYWRIREKSIEGFVALTGHVPATTEFLNRILDSREVNTIRKRVMDLLVAFGDPKRSRTPLLERLAVQDEDYLIRRSALEQLWEYFGDHASVHALMLKRVADDPDETVRLVASAFLAKQ